MNKGWEQASKEFAALGAPTLKLTEPAMKGGLELEKFSFCFCFCFRASP